MVQIAELNSGFVFDYAFTAFLWSYFIEVKIEYRYLISNKLVDQMLLLLFSPVAGFNSLHYSNRQLITLHLKQNAERDDLLLELCVVCIAKPYHRLSAKVSLILKDLYIYYLFRIVYC